MYNKYQKGGVLPANIRNDMIMKFRYLLNKAENPEELRVIWKCINTLFGRELWLVKKLEADKNRRKHDFGLPVEKPTPVTEELALQILESED